MRLSHQSAKSTLSNSSKRRYRSAARCGSSRKGLTLLEMLLSAVILVTALSVLAQHNSTASTAALRSQLETEAALRCQSQLNRLLYADHLPSHLLERQFDDDPRWYWSATKSPSNYDGLWLLTVDVFQTGRHKSISSFSLSRLCPDAAESSGSFSSADRR